MYFKDTFLQNFEKFFDQFWWNTCTPWNGSLEDARNFKTIIVHFSFINRFNLHTWIVSKSQEIEKKCRSNCQLQYDISKLHEICIIRMQIILFVRHLMVLKTFWNVNFCSLKSWSQCTLHWESFISMIIEVLISFGCCIDSSVTATKLTISTRMSSADDVSIFFFKYFPIF